MTLTIYYDNAIVYAHSQQTEQTCRNEYNGTENRVKDKRRKKNTKSNQHIRKSVTTIRERVFDADVKIWYEFNGFKSKANNMMQHQTLLFRSQPLKSVRSS